MQKKKKKKKKKLENSDYSLEIERIQNQSFFCVCSGGGDQKTYNCDETK